jgi:hypothetical protein
MGRSGADLWLDIITRVLYDDGSAYVLDREIYIMNGDRLRMGVDGSSVGEWNTCGKSPLIRPLGQVSQGLTAALCT